MDIEKTPLYDPDQKVFVALNLYNKFGGVRVMGFPNSPARMKALKRHDLHHIINDCGTSPTDEAIVAAWELGSGCNNYWIAWWLDLRALGIGALFLAPVECYKRFLLGRHSKNFYGSFLQESHYRLGLDELRSEMMTKQTEIKGSTKDFSLFVYYVCLGLVLAVLSMPIYLFLAVVAEIKGARANISKNVTEASEDS